MTPIPTSPQPATTLDELFSSPATILSNLDLDITGTAVTDAQLQRLAGCPGGGVVTVTDDAGAVYLESRHRDLIINTWRNANYVEIRRQGEDYYLYLDYIWFSDNCPKGFGAVVLLNMAYTAAELGFSHIELLAAGGTGIKGAAWTEEFWGYETWPRLGFDTELQPQMLALTAQEPELKDFTHVSEIVQANLDWWKEHGDGWTMTFDLKQGSASWDTLYMFCKGRGLLK
ncbi:hypothetical protein [Janthinobacterium sp. PC23-8]|uniref:hypothetical protein n=1 Tax=Janthinobacterium sp. PC23-8 TaxID=2012679 RepID=UPI000B95D460|nr:hypothetical protein [Janthinobacterium sp. PC23-8]OYO31214.1 hypothetical protein CD932_08825 [Janthinobacterium sp. PC23-8]